MVKTKLWLKKVSKLNVGLTEFFVVKIICPKNFGSKNFGSNKFLVQKFLGAKEICFKMDSKKIWFKEILGPREIWGLKKFGPYCWHGQMLRGQMLLWQMSPRQSTSVKVGPKKLTINSSQNWVSNSWDIADMDKYHQNKCCTDKCHPDSWSLF